LIREITMSSSLELLDVLLVGYGAVGVMCEIT